MQLCLNIGGLAQGTGQMVNSLKSLCLQFTIRIVGIEWCLLLGCGIGPAWKPRPRLTLGLGWMRYQVVPWILSYLMQKSNMVWVGGLGSSFVSRLLALCVWGSWINGVRIVNAACRVGIKP